jgi:hypothetical protein
LALIGQNGPGVYTVHAIDKLKNPSVILFNLPWNKSTSENNCLTMVVHPNKKNQWHVVPAEQKKKETIRDAGAIYTECCDYFDYELFTLYIQYCQYMPSYLH